MYIDKYITYTHNQILNFQAIYNQYTYIRAYFYKSDIKLMEDNKQNLNLPTNSSVQQETATSITHDHVYDKSQSLIDIANSTFRELCKTLDTEQTKLLDLEKRRKTLQEDLHRLKTEIEKQKQLYQINMVQGLSENLKTLNNRKY